MLCFMEKIQRTLDRVKDFKEEARSEDESNMSNI